MRDVMMETAFTIAARHCANESADDAISYLRLHSMAALSDHDKFLYHRDSALCLAEAFLTAFGY